MSTEIKLPEAENGFWALVEIFGHQRIVGFVSDFQLGGESFIRVDVPGIEETPAFTKLYGKGAIYAISPMSEQLARRLAASVRAVPIHAYELPQIAGPARRDGDDDGDERTCDDPTCQDDDCPVHGASL